MRSSASPVLGRGLRRGAYRSSKPRGDPFHLRTIGGRFLGNNDVAAIRENALKSLQHSIGAANDLVVELRIGLVEPTSHADSSGHRIDFGNDVAVVGQDEVGPDDPRQIVANFLSSRKLDQVLRLARVEVTRHPLRLLSFDALLVKLIAGALENKKPMTKLLEVGQEFLADGKRIGRKEPILFREETLLREGTADRLEFLPFDDRRDVCGLRFEV